MSFSVLYLVASGLLWGTGGVTGTLLGRAAGLSAISVAACRLLAGGGLIVARTVCGKRWPTGRAAWTRIAVTGPLAALFQACYFTAVSLTSVSLATLVTIGEHPSSSSGRAVARAAGAGGAPRHHRPGPGRPRLAGRPARRRFGQAAMLESAALASSRGRGLRHPHPHRAISRPGAR